jgi:hypothetical protein
VGFLVKVQCSYIVSGHKYSWASPYGKIHSQIEYILIDKQRHASVRDLRSFKAADYDTDHCLVVAKFRGETGSE